MTIDALYSDRVKQMLGELMSSKIHHEIEIAALTAAVSEKDARIAALIERAKAQDETIRQLKIDFETLRGDPPEQIERRRARK